MGTHEEGNTMNHNDSDLCACGHDRGSHWDGTGKCGYCGTPGNGIFPCIVFTDGEEFRAAHGEHVAHFMGEFF